jgi:hypothetical protein
MVRGRFRPKASSLTLPFQPGVSRGWGVTASVADAARLAAMNVKEGLGVPAQILLRWQEWSMWRGRCLPLETRFPTPGTQEEHRERRGGMPQNL